MCLALNYVSIQSGGSITTLEERIGRFAILRDGTKRAISSTSSSDVAKSRIVLIYKVFLDRSSRRITSFIRKPYEPADI